MARIKVCVLFGGASNEHDISLHSAVNVINSIPKDKYDITCVGITKKGRWLYFPGDVSEIADNTWETNPDCTSAVLSPDPLHGGFIVLENGEATIRKIDVVFPVLHGKPGEDGSVQGLLDMACIPYVGSDILASASAMDKSHTHMMLDYNGIKNARWRLITAGELSNLEEKCKKIAEAIGYPLFVKPANGGSSIGVNKAENLEDLIKYTRLSFTHDQKVIIEECISGRELEVAVFGYDAPFASFVGEIPKENDFYDYDAKYIKKQKTEIPAKLDTETSTKIRDIAVKTFKVIGCRGLARVDFFLTPENKIYVNELNTMPGFTDISMYPALMNHLGMTDEYLVDKLLQQAIEYSGRMY